MIWVLHMAKQISQSPLERSPIHCPNAKTVVFPVPSTTRAYCREAICGVTESMADKKFETKVPRSENTAVLFEQMRAAGVALGSDREGLIKENKMMMMMTKTGKR